MDQNQEQIDELSKSTLGSYVKKAASSAAASGKGEGSNHSPTVTKQYAGTKNQRLSGISKATDRLTKEEVEPLAELSAGKLQDYKKAATERPLAKDGDKTAGGILKAARKRVAGVKTASRKLGEEAEVEQVEEGLIDKVKGLVGQSAAQKASKAHAQRRQDRLKREAEGAAGQKKWGHVEWDRADKPGYKKEEFEQVDELNRDTLNSYQKKADKELDQRLPKVIKAHNSSEPLSDADKKNAHKAHSRTIGSMRAHERLNKEEVELEEAKLSIPTHDEFAGNVKQSPTAGEHAKLSTKGQLKMLAMAARTKYVSHTNVEVPGTQVKEEAIVRKGDAVTPTSAELVPPSVPTKKNPKPFGNGAASPTAPEPMKGITCKEEVLDELSTATLGAYKKAAGADASAKDKAGDFKGADKRFSGIVKATKKQFNNETKKESVLISFKDFIKEQKLAAVPYIAEEAEVIEEGLRLVGTHGVHGAGSKSAKVYKSADEGDLVVKFYTNGEHLADADYRTADKEDAHGTAKNHMISPNYESIVHDGEQIDELSGSTLKSYGQKAQKQIESLPSGHPTRTKRISGGFKALGKRMDKTANKTADRE